MPKNFQGETFDYICNLSKLSFSEEERPLVEAYVDEMLTKLQLPDVPEQIRPEDTMPMSTLRQDVVTNPPVAADKLQKFIVPRSI